MTFKKLLKLLSLAFALVLMAEVVFGYVHYLNSLQSQPAALWFVSRLKDKYFPSKSEYTSIALDPQTYRRAFSKWLAKIKHDNSVPILLYIPEVGRRAQSQQSFFEDLAETEGIKLFDLTDTFLKYPETWLYNLPSDKHPSRMAHQLIASQISASLLTDKISFKEPDLIGHHQAINGPYRKNARQIWEYKNRPYLITTDQFGFRSDTQTDLHKPTILMLGNSYTFGTGVNSDETFTALLNASFPAFTFINAGIPGTGLQAAMDEYNRLSEDIDPDMVIIQVMDNHLPRN